MEKVGDVLVSLKNKNFRTAVGVIALFSFAVWGSQRRGGGGKDVIQT